MASTLFSLQPASASFVIGALYNGTSGDVACTTGGADTGFFTILNNVVKKTSNYSCAGVAVIPVGVTSVEEFAFQDRVLTSVSIPNTVLSIGRYAFSFQFLITTLTIPDGVTSLGDSAFAGLNQITSYEYCGTSLTNANLIFAGLGSKVKTCTPSITAPGAPTSIVVTTGKRIAKVRFGAPTNNGGSAVTSYTATSTPGGFTQTHSQSADGTFYFDGLEPSTFYSFAVTATNAIGTSAATSSNVAKTLALDVASLAALSFQDDGTGTGDKIVCAGMNIDAVLYTGPKTFYPGPFNYGSFTGGWNGRIRNLIPDTTYTVTITAISADGVGGNRSLTFKTNSAPSAVSGATGATTVQTEATKLEQLLKWVDENTYVTGEAANMSGLLRDFAALKTSPSSTRIRVPLSSVSNVVATSLTPNACSVVSATAAVDAGIVTALTTGKCTISYTVSGGSKAPATYVRDFVFTYFELKCGYGSYIIKAGVVSRGETCTGAVTIDPIATSMANAAFSSSLITSITLPNSIIKIPDYAFSETPNLVKVELGNAVSGIGIGAFRSSGVTSILLPNSLTTVKDYAFLGSGLTTLIFPTGTTWVGNAALQSLLSFTTLTIPTTVTYMYLLALQYSGAQTVYYCGNNASVLAAIRRISYWAPITATCVK